MRCCEIKVPPKWFGSAVCNTMYISICPSVHKQLIRTILEGRPVYISLLVRVRSLDGYEPNRSRDESSPKRRGEISQFIIITKTKRR